MQSKKKTTTKKAVTALTPRQAEIKAASLMRGLDNSFSRIKKEFGVVESIRAEIGSITSGLASAAAAKPAQKPAKPAPPAKAAAAKKVAPAAKKVAQAKPKAAAKPAPAVKKTAAAKPSAASKAKNGGADWENKEPVSGRPTLREALKEVMKSGDPLTPMEARKAACLKYGYYSKQSTYNLLKKDPAFKAVDGGKKVVLVPPSEEDLELASKVEKDRATEAVV